MKKLLIIAAVIVLSACGGGGGGQDEGAPDCSATLWGDSIGVSIPAKMVGFDVTNKASSGDSAKGRAAEFMADPITTRFTVVQWGMNDISATTTAAEHAERIAKMAQHAQQRGSVVVLTGISGTVGFHDEKRAEFNSATRGIASFVDWGAVPYEPADLPDGVHPAPAYEARLVAALTEHLRALAPECK